MDVDFRKVGKEKNYREKKRAGKKKKRTNDMGYVEKSGKDLPRCAPCSPFNVILKDSESWFFPY